MDRSFWSFFLNGSEGAVPYPWERCYDVMDEILFYKNNENKAVVFDLRSEVNLGGGLVHYNRKRKAITGRLCGVLNREIPVVILANCCGPQVFFFEPEIVQRCPICDIPVLYSPLHLNTSLSSFKEIDV